MRNIYKNLLFRFILIFVVLLAVRVPFYLTNHIQEDAYITLRCAGNLAETGVYGYNPGERVSASTAHLYVFLAALLRLVVGEQVFIPAVQLINTVLFLFGAYFVARALAGEEGRILWLWALLSLLPISLRISYSGMETSLLLFLVGLVLYAWQRGVPAWVAWLGLALLPWVRPDAVAYALILLFWHSLKEKKFEWKGTLGLLTGFGAWFGFNKLYFGSWLTQSILAKSLSSHTFTFPRFWENLRQVFAENVGGIFNPVPTKYLDQAGYLFLAITLAAAGYYIWSRRGNRDAFYHGLIAATIAFSVPVAYAGASVVFPWYMWPSTFFGFALVAALLVDWMNAGGWKGRVLAGVLGIFVLGGLVAQWAYSYSWGMKERTYRGGIGEYLAGEAEPGDTLFLEPAGYIPYYAGLYTYDEVGLSSPLVVYYHEAKPEGWWADFLQDLRPEWVVQRAQIQEHQTYQGFTIPQAEWKWFKLNYTLVREFHYNATDYTLVQWLQRLLELGTIDDYYVYHLVK